MIFVLDNYDSFTYNLVQLLGELGAEVEVRRNDQITVEEVESGGKRSVSSGCATEILFDVRVARSIRSITRARRDDNPCNETLSSTMA